MPLETWMLLWKWTLGISLALFTLMTVVVSIGSIFDIRRLFQRLRRDAHNEESR